MDRAVKRHAKRRFGPGGHQVDGVAAYADHDFKLGPVPDKDGLGDLQYLKPQF